MAELFVRLMSPRSPTAPPMPPAPGQRAAGWARLDFTRSSTTASASLPGATAERVRLFTRHGTDFTARYPKIAAAVASLPVRSCALDGEAIVVDEDGLSIFDLSAIGITTMPPCSAPSI